MNVLEKILEEIEELKRNQDSKNQDFVTGYISALSTVEGVIAGLDEAKDINVPSNDGWIPVEKKLPEEGQKVLVWYEYFRYGEYNRMFKTYGIGWQFDGHWSGDVSGTKARCIAWQPLPKAYRRHQKSFPQDAKRHIMDRFTKER